MKKRRIVIAIFLCAVVLSGCRAAAPTPSAVVTAIDVEVVQNGRQDRYTLVEEEQMRRLLNILRLLGSGDTAHIDPERILSANCRIRLYLSDGSCHIYRHAGGQYLSVDSHSWHQVDPQQSKNLYDILSNFQQKIRI